MAEEVQREKLNHQVSQNNLREEETSKEEDLFKEAEEEAGIMRLDVIIIRGNLRSKMGLIRKHAKISSCELEFKNQ